ncbi:MAG: DUF2092 domain-containing protein [Pseudomonadota bacterium]
MRDLITRTFAGCAMLIAGSVVSFAQDGDPMMIINKMSSDFGAEERVRIVTTSMYDEPFEDTFIKTTVRHRSDIKRPNQLITEAVFDDGSRWAVSYDGKTILVYDFSELEYSRIDFAGELNALADFMDDNGLSNTPLIDYIRDNFVEAIEDPASEVTLIDGYVDPAKPTAKTHHFLFDSPGTSWQLWVVEGEKSLPSRLVLEYDDFGRPEYLVTFDEWIFGAEAGVFGAGIDIPSDLAGWKQVEFENPINFGSGN